MRDLTLTINGIRFKAKNLDDEFAAHVEKLLEESDIHSNRDNAAEKLFLAFLRLAAQNYNYEKEIEGIIEA